MADNGKAQEGNGYQSKFMTKWRHIAVIDREIRAEKYPSAPELAERLELSDRTIKRHIEFMRYDLGAPIEYEPSKKGYFYREADWVMPAVRVCEGELFALVVGEQALRGLRNHPLATKLERVFQKIALRLPDEVQVDPHHLASGLSFSPPPVSPPDADLFTELACAARDGRTVEMTYYKLSADEEVERTVDPYALRSFDGEWYLAGHSHETGYVSLFHMSRIREAEQNGDFFNKDEIDFDADEYFGATLGPGHGEEDVPVRVRFHGWAARYVCEREWHPEQTVEEGEDGTVVVELPAGWLDEAASWVMSFGELAEVLEPDELREQACDRLEQALESYRV